MSGKLKFGTGTDSHFSGATINFIFNGPSDSDSANTFRSLHDFLYASHLPLRVLPSIDSNFRGSDGVKNFTICLGHHQVIYNSGIVRVSEKEIDPKSRLQSQLMMKAKSLTFPSRLQDLR